MKASTKLITLGLVGVGLTWGSATFAETDREREARERAALKHSDHDHKADPRSVQSPSALVMAKDTIGQKVINTDGKVIGHIEELIIDPRNGTIQYGVLAVGRGFLGIGDKSIAIPWEDLHLSATQQGYLLDVNKDTLAKAPGFDREHPRYDDRDSDRVYRDRHYRDRDEKVRREPLRDDQDTYVGRVESIDRDNNTISVRKALITHKFLLDDAAHISMDRIKVGEKVEVTYTKREDAKVAQYIDVLDDDGNVRSDLNTDRRVDADGDGRVDR